jgi:hypothetical protein
VDAEATDQTEQGQALVPLDAAEAETRHASPRSSAPFLAQLIAIAQGAPQTRERRRAEPAEAAAAYLRAGRS